MTDITPRIVLSGEDRSGPASLHPTMPDSINGALPAAPFHMRARRHVELDGDDFLVGEEFDADSAIAVQLFMRGDAEPVADRDRLRLWGLVWPMAGRLARHTVAGLFRLSAPPAVRP